MTVALKRLGWVFLGLLAGGLAVSGQTRETLACVARLEVPEYPSLARAARIEGIAETTFTVRNDGSPESVVVVAPNGELKRQIERLLAESKFSRNCAGARLELRVKLAPASDEVWIHEGSARRARHDRSDIQFARH